MNTMTTIGCFERLVCSKGKAQPVTGYKSPEV